MTTPIVTEICRNGNPDGARLQKAATAATSPDAPKHHGRADRRPKGTTARTTSLTTS